MPHITAIIGKPCSGKTTYANTLPGVLLSCDNFMLPLFGQQCELIRKNRKLVESYLLELARQMLAKGIDVVFDWGFWTAADRARLNATGLPVQWVYVCVPEQQRVAQMTQRNNMVQQQGLREYFVHDELFARSNAMFEEPEEIDGLIRVLGM